MPDGIEKVKIRLNKKYAPLFDDNCQARYYIVTGGRGSGKSFAISLSGGKRLVTSKFAKNTLYLRQTLVSAHISIIPEFYQKLELLGCGDYVKCGKTDILFDPTGSKMYFRGIQTSRGSNEANLKSVKDVACVIIDEAQELVDEPTFDRIDLSLRDTQVQNRVILSLNPTDKTHWIYKRFFERPNLPDDYNGIVGDVCYIHTTYEDNRCNLSEDFLKIAERCKQEDIEKYNNIFLGLWRGDKEGALWNDSMISTHRVASAPDELDRVVVAVDPAVTGNKTSDETGIVVAGRKRLRGSVHYFVIADKSLRGSPETWAKTVVNAYFDNDADRVVAEVNNGGDLVEATIQSVATRKIPYRAVRATRGKVRRAEPIAALYEQGLVHHVGNFSELEYQMRNYNGEEKGYSPDRMDALVWALTELSQHGGSCPIFAK